MYSNYDRASLFILYFGTLEPLELVHLTSGLVADIFAAFLLDRFIDWPYDPTNYIRCRMDSQTGLAGEKASKISTSFIFLETKCFF